MHHRQPLPKFILSSWETFHGNPLSLTLGHFVIWPQQHSFCPDGPLDLLQMMNAKLQIVWGQKADKLGLLHQLSTPLQEAWPEWGCLAHCFHLPPLTVSPVFTNNPSILWESFVLSHLLTFAYWALHSTSRRCFYPPLTSCCSAPPVTSPLGPSSAP